MELVILTFILISFFYAVFLLKNKFRFVSLFFLAMYSTSFLLPVIINIKFDYMFYLSDSFYEKLKWMYLVGLIIFIAANFIFNFFKIKSIDNNMLKPHVLNKKSINKIFLIFLLMFFIMVMIIGAEVIISGTTSTLELPPIIKMFQSITTIGFVYSALLKVYYSENKRETLVNVLLSIIVILSVLVFIFGRRLILYPVIAIIALIIFKKNKAPSLWKLLTFAIATITVFLPAMMSIRTLGFKEGIKNFTDILFGDYDKYLQYLSIGTDVTASYSLAGVILAYDTRITPLTLLKPILSFVPRSIFPDKPRPMSEAIVENLNLNYDKGMSIPPGIVGESHLYGGLIGVFIMFIFFGVMCGIIDNYISYLRTKDQGLRSINIIFLVLVSIQFISGSIRGDTATNMQECMYLFIPLLFIMILSKYKFIYIK